MQWRDMIAILLCVGVVFVVLKSMMTGMKSATATPLRGKLSTAREWLQENGYQIVRVRERGEWVGYYGERAFTKSLIADFVVRQGTKYFVVKVLNPRDKGVNGLKLRDQWFPLYVTFGVQGVIHLDVDAEKVQIVDFDIKSPKYVLWRRVINRGLWLASGMIIALAWFHGNS